MVAQDLITESAISLRVLRPGEGLNTEEYAQGLSILNELLDAWQAVRLLIYAIVRATYTLVGNQQTYQIGPGAADFNTTRPIRIEAATLLASGGRQFPLELINHRQWLDILQSTAAGNFPRKLYNDSAFPISKLYLWPVPSGTPQLVLDTWQQLITLPALTTTVALPPAFQEAIRYNLALRVAAMLGVLQIPPDVIAQAKSSYETVAAMVRATQGMPDIATVDSFGTPAPMPPPPGSQPPPQET
jgi:hypothetical protein